MIHVITLQQDEYDLIVRLVQRELEKAEYEVEHGRSSNYGMGQGTVQAQQRTHHELAQRTLTLMKEPR